MNHRNITTTIIDDLGEELVKALSTKLDPEPYLVIVYFAPTEREVHAWIPVHLAHRTEKITELLREGARAILSPERVLGAKN